MTASQCLYILWGLSEIFERSFLFSAAIYPLGQDNVNKNQQLFDFLFDFSDFLTQLSKDNLHHRYIPK